MAMQNLALARCPIPLPNRDVQRPMPEPESRALARAGYNRIPLHLETFADLDTPLSIYLKLANWPGSYLLESVIGGDRCGRYSIVGLPGRDRRRVSRSSIPCRRWGALPGSPELG